MNRVWKFQPKLGSCDCLVCCYFYTLLLHVFNLIFCMLLSSFLMCFPQFTLRSHCSVSVFHIHPFFPLSGKDSVFCFHADRTIAGLFSLIMLKIWAPFSVVPVEKCDCSLSIGFFSKKKPTCFNIWFCNITIQLLSHAHPKSIFLSIIHIWKRF